MKTRTKMALIASMLLMGTLGLRAEQPPGCQTSGSFITITVLPAQAAYDVGQQVRYVVTMENPTLSGAGLPNCNISNVWMTLTLPDNTVVPVLTNQNLAAGGNAIVCPGDAACLSPSNAFNYVIRAQDIRLIDVNQCPATAGTTRAITATLHREGTVALGTFGAGLNDNKCANSPVVSPCLSCSKNCVNGGPDGIITFSGSVVNCDTNAGFLGALQGVTVVDVINGVTNVIATGLTLTNGQTFPFSGSITNGNICAPITDTIYVTGFSAAGSAVTTSCSATCSNISNPCITVTKNCDTVVVGSANTVSGVVSNCGNITLTNISISDNLYGTLATFSVLAPGAAQTYSSQVTNSCGNFPNFVTATGTTICGTQVQARATNTCVVTENPCIRVTKSCDTVTIGSANTVSALVTNCGNVPLHGITVTDNLYGSIGTIATLAVGGSSTLTKFVTNTSCGDFPNTVTATGLSPCNTGVTNTSAATCSVICQPAIKVYKQVVCVDAQGNCLPFNADLNTQKTAMGVTTVDALGQEHCTAFCYRITVSNTSPAGIELRNLQIVDTNYPGGIPVDLASFGCSFTNRLTEAGTPGSSASCIVSGVTLCDSTENIVTATAVGVLLSTTNIIGNVSDKDTNNVVIIPFDITCEKEASVDGGVTWANSVNIVSGAPTSVSYRVTVHNNSGLPLVATINDATFGCGIITVAIPANGSVTTNLCTVSVTCPPGTNNIVNVSAVVDTSKTNVCVYTANNGGPVTDTTRCEASVTCTPPAACRVTGGGRQDDPLVCPSDVRYVTHGGQVGAPVGNQVCSIDTNLPNFFLGNPCIHGRWTHVRHVQGGLEGNFHARFFDTLDCACLDTNLNPTTCQFGPGTVLHDVCGDRSTGPLPRKAPANKIAFTGVGDWACPNGRREPRACLFRVDIEDRGEPGNAHALASNKKDNRIPDRYRIRIWVLSDDELQQLQGRHATGDDQWLLNFRNAISACNGIDYQDGGVACNTANTCSSDDSCTAGAAGPGSVTFPGGAPVRLPNIDDGGELLHGNHQIHPAIKDCDPYNPTGPGLAKP